MFYGRYGITFLNQILVFHSYFTNSFLGAARQITLLFQKRCKFYLAGEQNSLSLPSIERFTSATYLESLTFPSIQSCLRAFPKYPFASITVISYSLCNSCISRSPRFTTYLQLPQAVRFLCRNTMFVLTLQYLWV